jgi:hypothetical protein
MLLRPKRDRRIHLRRAVRGAERETSATVNSTLPAPASAMGSVGLTSNKTADSRRNVASAARAGSALLSNESHFNL